jgi:hypothetical protein
MKSKTAGDLMVPLDEYPIVDASASVLDAVIRLDEFRKRMEPGRQPFQAVLVADKNGSIIGKMGQWALLKTLEPIRQVYVDEDTLEKAGVSDQIMQTALDHLRSFRREFSDMCEGAKALAVSKVMHPIREHIDIGDSIHDVIHWMVTWRTLSLLVTERGRPVGLVRLSDLCDEVIAEMLKMAAANSGKD